MGASATSPTAHAIRHVPARQPRTLTVSFNEESELQLMRSCPGQRPSYRRNDYDAPPSPDVAGAGDAASGADKPPIRQAESFDAQVFKSETPLDEEEAGELTDHGM